MSHFERLATCVDGNELLLCPGNALWTCREHDLLVLLATASSQRPRAGGVSPVVPSAPGVRAATASRVCPRCSPPCSCSRSQLAGCAQVGLGDEMLPFVRTGLELILLGVLGVLATRQKTRAFLFSVCSSCSCLYLLGWPGLPSYQADWRPRPQAPCWPQSLEASFYCY